MKYLIILLLCLLSTAAQSQSSTDENVTIGGLKRDCDDRIAMYLTPRGLTGNKNIDLSKYPAWDLTNSYLNPKWNEIKQGSAQGSCTSFAVAFAISIQNSIDNFIFNKQKNQDIYSPSFIFNVAKSNYDEPYKSSCGEGISYIDAFLILKDRGIPKYSSYKYIEASDGCFSKYYPNKNIFIEAQKRKIAIFQRPFKTVDNFKRMLLDTPFYPICIGVVLSSEYDKASSSSNGLWKYPGYSNGTRLHAMVIVGFNNSKHAFKVMDWQGKDHGDNGFIWMDYDLIPNINVVFDAYICSHGTEYLDPSIGGATRGVNYIYDTTETKCFEKDGISCYVKNGYFIVKNKFRILCTYVSGATNKASFRIYDKYTNEVVYDDLIINGGENNCFSYLDNNYVLNVVKIDSRGKNPFTKAAIINLQPIDSSTCKNSKSVSTFIKTTDNARDERIAKDFETKGFQSLLSKSLDDAIYNFKQSENSYNGYHSVYDIANDLEKIKEKFTNDDKSWKDLYEYILKNRSWRMPNEIKEQLNEAIK